MQTLAQLDHTGDRVREHTAEVVNTRIDTQTIGSIEQTIRGGRNAIVRRLADLDREWDIDRALMVNFAVIGGTSFATGLRRYSRRPILGVLGKRRKGAFGFFGVQLGFLLLHGIVGWCPPASLFRRLGFRTQREIELERRALQTALASA
jgi:hypothetical protein